MRSLWGKLTGEPAKSAELLELERCYSPDELQVTHQQFQSALAVQSGATDGAAPGVHESGFLHLCGLPELETSLGTALFQLASRGQLTASEVDVLRLKAAFERQGEETAQDTVYSLLSPVASCNSSVPLPALKSRIAAAVRLWLHAGKCSSTNNSTGNSGNSGSSGSLAIPGLAGTLSGDALDRQVEAVALGALSSSGSSSSQELTRDGYTKWCKTCPALQRVLSRLLTRVGVTGPSNSSRGSGAMSITSKGGSAGTRSSPQERRSAADAGGGPGTAHAASPPSPQALILLPMPVFAQAAAYDIATCLLQPVYMWALCSILAPDLRMEWRPLFSSHRDGKSFQTLMSRCAAAPGPTLLLVRDMEGHLFGGFAPQPWEKHGSFYGDFTTFIFSLEPHVQVYPASGINTNFQWCGLGFKELPSGIGFGGAAGDKNLGAFALYLDSTLDAGQSRPIATFANPPLAGESQRFQVSSVECWLLKPPDEDELLFQQGGRKGGSALDKAQEDQAIMEHMGKGMQSHGFRGGGRPEDDL